MTDLDAVFAAILADPSCDVSRLAYADALEERGGPGDAERAEFIRLGMEKSRYGSRDPELHCGGTGACNACLLAELYRRADYQRCAKSLRASWVVDRLTELVKANRWFDHLTFRKVRAECHKGFVETVGLTTEDWHQLGPRLVREHPIRVVRLTDRRAEEWPEGWNNRAFTWTSQGRSRWREPHMIPAWLWPKMAGRHIGAVTLATLDEADSRLSDACLAWAKSVKPRANRESSASRRSAASRRTAAGSSPGTSRQSR